MSFIENKLGIEKYYMEFEISMFKRINIREIYCRSEITKIGR